MQQLSPVDLPILQELGIPVFAFREAAPTLEASSHHDFVVVVEEAEADFTPAHQDQLHKIMMYLGRASGQYLLCHSPDSCHSREGGNPSENSSINALLSFGAMIAEWDAKTKIETHSLSVMLQNPACKRQVLNDLQPFKS